MIPKIRFKSDPELTEGQSQSQSQSQSKTTQKSNCSSLLSPHVQIGDSDDSLSNKPKSHNSRKSSTTSGGKRLSFFSLLIQPFTYIQEKVGKSSKMSPNYDDGEHSPQIFHLHVPKCSVRKKYNSAPDLWAVKTSPIITYSKKTAVMSDSIALKRFEERESGSNPLLQLTLTSNESSYL